MNIPTPDPNNPMPTPDNPHPEPARPPPAPETPPPEPPGVPQPSPDPVPSPGEEPIQIPPGSPPEVPPGPDFPRPAAVNVEPGVSQGLISAAIVLGCVVATVALATAQSSNGSEEVVPSDPCQAEPADRSQNQTSDKSKELPRPQNKLEHCEGVLTPPETGDRIEEPPPDTGTTRIIRPDDVPVQPPN
jgi:hypothetical protein